MDTLALVLAVLFVGQVIDLRGGGPNDRFALLLCALTFGGALALGLTGAVNS